MCRGHPLIQQELLVDLLHLNHHIVVHRQNIVNLAKCMQSMLEPVSGSCLGLAPDVSIGLAGCMSQFAQVVGKVISE
jgi:hypothetical protein